MPSTLSRISPAACQRGPGDLPRKKKSSVGSSPTRTGWPSLTCAATGYTRRQLYAVVSDVASYASFVPFCKRPRVLVPPKPVPTPMTPNALQMEAELTAVAGCTQCSSRRRPRAFLFHLTSIS
ncbi:hypothetical protein F5148DRAFT_1204597 [Russula earlei]|uniref:Uncharacterized protein n=1 Tax=Russula earlei TaxID=71964 RepID=A0ACC0U763_9AGAM|nr:hypothetical protein F5148DRAFT_1204597 [Russula earlei]